MEGPEIEGPPIWLNLNRQAEEKLLGFCKNNNARLQWLDDYLAEAKAKLGVKCEEPTFVPKVRHLFSKLKTIHFTNFYFSYLISASPYWYCICFFRLLARARPSPRGEAEGPRLKLPTRTSPS